MRFPHERDRRDELAAGGIPRLLLVEPGTDVPRLADDEDWIRLPADERDVAARLQNLAARLAHAVTLEGRVLRSARGAVTLSESQAAVAGLLVPGVLVAREALLAAAPGGGARSLDDVLYRLRQRIRPIGLDLFTARSKGVVLGARTD